MTDKEQQRANHLALVAAPIYASFWGFIREGPKEDHNKSMLFALDIAEALQKAAEERAMRE